MKNLKKRIILEITKETSEIIFDGIDAKIKKLKPEDIPDATHPPQSIVFLLLDVYQDHENLILTDENKIKTFVSNIEKAPKRFLKILTTLERENLLKSLSDVSFEIKKTKSGLAEKLIDVFLREREGFNFYIRYFYTIHPNQSSNISVFVRLLPENADPTHLNSESIELYDLRISVTVKNDLTLQAVNFELKEYDPQSSIEILCKDALKEYYEFLNEILLRVENKSDFIYLEKYVKDILEADLEDILEKRKNIKKMNHSTYVEKLYNHLRKEKQNLKNKIPIHNIILAAEFLGLENLKKVHNMLVGFPGGEGLVFLPLEESYAILHQPTFTTGFKNFRKNFYNFITLKHNI